MDVVLWPFRALWKIYFFIVFISTLLLLFPFFFITLSKEKWFKYAFLLFRFWSLILQVFAGVILIIKKEEPLPKGTPFIICPNHSSYLDIILMYRVFPEYFVFMGKQEITNWPLFNIFFTKGMNILVDRSSMSGARNAILNASEDIAKGHSIVIFPEATIPHSAPKLNRFKNGAFKLAIAKQIPIVPVTFTTNWKLLQGTVFLKGRAGPGISKCIIHKPIECKGLNEDDMAALSEKVHDIIEKPLIDKYGDSVTN